MDELEAEGVAQFYFKESMVTSTAHGRAMLEMAALFARLEREMIRQRVKAGLARVKAEGPREGKKAIGRPRIDAAKEDRIRELKPSIRHEVKAAHELLRLAKGASAVDVTDTALAMYLMQDAEPRRFKSDQAFWTQLVRRVRGLAEVNAGTYWDQESGKVKRVYRDTPPRVTAVMKGWLVEAFGGAGLHLAQLERRDDEARRGDREAMRQALAALN
jgi:hypothetical protein